MKKRFIRSKTVFRTVLAVILSFCLVCSVPVVSANALANPDSFNTFRANVFTGSE